MEQPAGGSQQLARGARRLEASAAQILSPLLQAKHGERRKKRGKLGERQAESTRRSWFTLAIASVVLRMWLSHKYNFFRPTNGRMRVHPSKVCLLFFNKCACFSTPSVTVQKARLEILWDLGGYLLVVRWAKKQHSHYACIQKQYIGVLISYQK